MKKGEFIFLILAGCVFFSTSAVSAEVDTPRELADRIEKLERKMEETGEILPEAWKDRITVSGAIEVEAGYVSTDPDGGDGTDESDISVATVELGVEARIVKHVSGNILFLYEDDEDVVIDEATITLSGEDVIPAYLAAGKMYLPFGKFESYMISDPLTLEIAESRESAIQVGFDSGGFHGSAFVFNGDVEEPGEEDNHIDNFGANAGYRMNNDGFTIDVGASYINNMVDADGWEDTLDGLTLNAYAAGMGAYAIVGFGPVTLIGEYVTALENIELLDDTDAAVYNDKISAWNLEAGYAFAMGEKEAVMALAFQGSEDAADLIPETRYLGTFGIGLFENTSLAVEYAHSVFENDDAEDAFTAQLAIEF